MNLLSIAPFSIYTLFGIGVILMGLEITLNSFYIIWFGIGFCAVGVLEYFMPFPSGIHQIATALAIAFLLLLTLKQKVKNLIRQSEKEIKDDFLNEVGDGIIKHGMVEFKGTLWEIDQEYKNLQDGTIVKVLQTKGNKAQIKAP